jgi:O-antigen/teichoic acid export membrane protein
MLRRIVQFSIWQALAQAMSAGTIFLLATLLPSGPLATFGYALSIGSLVSNFATLRVEQAVLVASSDDEAAILAYSAHACAFAVCVILAAAAAVFRFGSNWLALIGGSFSALSMSAVTVSQQILIRSGESVRAGRVATARALLITALVVGFVLASSRQTAAAPLVGLSLASVAVTLLCYYESRHVFRRIEWARHKEVVKAYSDVWSSYLGQSVLSGISLNAPYFAFFHTVNHELVASYLLADRLARTPIALLSLSVRSHLTHNYSDLMKQRRVKEAGGFMTAWSAGLALFGVVALVTVGICIMAGGNHYLSAKWANAGIAVLVLTPWAASTLSNSPAKAALTALRQNAYVFNVQAIELASRLTIIVLLLPQMTDHFFLILFCIHLPGIILNMALHIRAARGWRPLLV